jgi:hypothetical protein
MKTFLVALALFITGPAFATTDAWPALHEVVGVEEGDVLNIRSGPGIDHPIIGTLPHDATNIEVIAPNEDFTWGRMVTGEGMGWVSLTYVVPQPGQWDGKYPEFTSCHGTEPFWSLSRANNQISFEGLDIPALSAPIEFEGGTLNHRGRHSFRAGDLVGVLSNQLCSDGMSDVELGWEVNLIRLDDGTHFQGCCTLQPPFR